MSRRSKRQAFAASQRRLRATLRLWLPERGVLQQGQAWAARVQRQTLTVTAVQGGTISPGFVITDPGGPLGGFVIIGVSPP